MKNGLMILAVTGVVLAGAVSSASAATPRTTQVPSQTSSQMSSYGSWVARNGDEAIRLQGGGTAPHSLPNGSGNHENGGRR